MNFPDGYLIIVASICSSANVNFLTEENSSTMNANVASDRSILCDVVLTVSFYIQCVIVSTMFDFTQSVYFYTQWVISQKISNFIYTRSGLFYVDCTVLHTVCDFTHNVFINTGWIILLVVCNLIFIWGTYIYNLCFSVYYEWQKRCNWQTSLVEPGALGKVPVKKMWNIVDSQWTYKILNFCQNLCH